MIKCGDFSAWNGVVNWNRVKAAGLTHAVLKVIRRDFDPDKQFENNWKGCQLAGVHICGVYNYVYTLTVEEAVAAAKRVLEVLDGRKVTVWMDVEDECMQNLGSELIDIIKAYKEVIEGAGYDFGVYTGLSFYGSYIKPYTNPSDLDCPFWIARYYLGYDEMQLNDETDADKTPNIDHYLAGWQYTSSGVVDGVDGVCDLSEFYGFHNEEDNTEDNSEEDNTEDSTDEHVYATYAAYTDRWWGEVEDREDWAGAGDNKAITALIIKVSRGSVKYRVHLKGGDWLPYVTGFNYDDYDNGYAGDKKHEIDAIEIIYYTPEGEPWKYAKYMVSVFNNRNFYPEQIDDKTSNGMDGYAGVMGNAIDKFQLVVE
jgi:GH25 family lysozyme M1 (1,4-beta-N-acetylmuramidase)